MKTTLKSTCGLFSVSVLGLAAGAGVPSCGGTTSGDAGDTDGVTHWLDACDTDADCGALACLCGVCTRRCADPAACSGLDDAATCAVIEGCAEVDEPVCGLPPRDGGPACPPGGCATPGLCAAMDAAPNGDGCLDLVGVTWNGERCEAVRCGCAGADCGALYEDFGSCEQAHLSCHVGAPGCQRSTECVLDFATCCGSCGTNDVESLVAIRQEDYDAYRTHACPAGEACPDCAAGFAPGALALCFGSECNVVDIEPVIACAIDADCGLRYKDCCECDGIPSAANLVAVSDTVAYVELACDEGDACTSDCDVEYPPDMRAACVEGRCTVTTAGSTP